MTELSHKELLHRTQDGLCWLCGEPIDLSIRGGLMCASIDHLKPLSKGGDTELDNKLLAHSKCNSDRGNRRGPSQWAGLLALEARGEQ